MVTINWDDSWASEFSRIFPAFHMDLGYIVVDGNRIILVEELQWHDKTERRRVPKPDYNLEEDIAKQRGELNDLEAKLTEVQNQLRSQETFIGRMFHKLNGSQIQRLKDQEYELRGAVSDQRQSLELCEAGSFATTWVGGEDVIIRKCVERAWWDLDCEVGGVRKSASENLFDEKPWDRFRQLSREGRLSVVPSVLDHIPYALNVDVLHAILRGDQDKLDAINQDLDKNHSEGGKLKIFLDDVRDSEQIKVVGGTLEDVLLK